jgi:hypothetical protein
LSFDHGHIFREAWIAGVTMHYPLTLSSVQPISPS